MRQNWMVAVGLTALIAAAPASASELANRWFANGACWARTYDDAHIRRHPGQQVRRIWVGGRAGDARLSSSELNFGFALNGRRGGYGGMAVCRDRSISLVCGIEGDGGDFRLSRVGEQELQLTAEGRMALEGESDFSPELGAGQDRVFRLRRAPTAACRVER